MVENGPNPELIDFTRRLWIGAVLRISLLVLTMEPYVGLGASAWSSANAPPSESNWFWARRSFYGIVRPRRLARATMRNIRQNLSSVLVYKSAGVPIAAGVLYPFLGILISPMFAAFAMTASSILLVLDSLRRRAVCI